MSQQERQAAADVAKATGTFGDDPIGAILTKYDKDGNGTFDVTECVQPAVCTSTL